MVITVLKSQEVMCVNPCVVGAVVKLYSVQYSKCILFWRGFVSHVEI